jgi:hypothetical protein
MKNGFPAGNPIANILVIIAGTLVIAASIVLGFFAFIALSAVVLVAAAVIGVRVWWLKRKIEQGRGPNNGTPKQQPPAGVIEGEYQVVSKDREET